MTSTSRSIAPAPADGRHNTPNRDQSPSRPNQPPVQSSAEAFKSYSKHLSEREKHFLKKMDHSSAKFNTDVALRWPNTQQDPEMKQHFELYTKLLKEHTEKFARKAKEHVDFYRSNHPANPNPPAKK